MHTWIDAAHSLITVLYQIENSKFCRPDILKNLSEAIENAQVIPMHIQYMSLLCLIYVYNGNWGKPEEATFIMDDQKHIYMHL